MAGDRISFVVYVLLLCLVTGYGVSGTSLTWIYQNVQIVIISPREVKVDPNQNLVVQNFTNAVTGDFTSIVTFINVKKSNSGLIQCYSLSSLSKEANLSVQVNGSLDIAKRSLTVITNSTVDISCRAAGWFPIPKITWTLNHTVVNSSEYTTTSTATQVDLYNVNSTLKLTLLGNTSVTCIAWIEATEQSSTVNITATVAGSRTFDNTAIIIAATVSVGCFLLIVLIIIVVLVCCRKEKQREMSYQSTAWAASAKTSSDLSYKHNYNYDPDFSEVQRPLPSLPSVTNSTVSHPYEVHLDTDYSQVPGQRWNDTFLKKIRHVTHV
ncbi:uncharacterized protein LOC495454 [Xenopus laevis]|uniref:LOC495454 protein n=1 Tax=Xenopus laevis TaxID=8355 RepID=Q5U4R5_XENLA|nr:uncharacterized protein LOC495454 [Xenopus laevis]AAH84981.1 LOC495454 protein [Xenopus laevis]